MEISICLTDLGQLSITSNVNIYSNWDNFINPIYTNVPVSSLYGANCSFTATVPNGTTELLFNDPVINCNTYLTIESSDFCVECNLRFDVYTATSVSRINVGKLIDDCSGTTITDYIIDWYGPDSLTNIGYTSGFGTAFPGFAFTHPLTGSSAIFAQSGVYVPVLRKIKINGITYTQSGGTGSVLANLDCISGATTFTVLPFNCTNGSSSKPQYTHQVQFQSLGVGAVPPPLDATFELSSTTKYFAFAFKAYEISDTITFTFSGSSYSGPIVIESLKTGTGAELSNSSNTFSPNVVTKSAQTGNQNFISKVLTLTGLTINNGDKIIINVTPNQGNTKTDWDLFFNGCLTTFDCNHCLSNPSPNAVISGSTIQILTGSCNTRSFKYRLSGCTDAYLQSDFYNYYFFGNTSQLAYFNNPYVPYQTPSNFTPNGISGLNQLQYIRSLNKQCGNNGYCNSCTNNVSSCTRLCSTPNNNYIRYQKTPGLFTMYFSDVSDYNFYLAEINCALDQLLNSCFPLYENDPTKSGYFKTFNISVPGNVTGPIECGDGNIPTTFVFHVTTQVTTSFSGGLYIIELTMPQIINLVPIVNCENCFSVCENVKNEVNSNSLSSGFDITSNRGSRYVNPIFKYFVNESRNSNYILGASESLYVPRYINETYMYSGAPLTLIPSLTAQTCDLGSYMTYIPQDQTKNNHFYSKTLYYYLFVILERLNHIARLDGSFGSIDNTLIQGQGFNNQTRSVAIQTDGKILVGGTFTTYDLTPANCLIRLDSNGSIDTSFLTNIGSGTSSLNSDIYSIAIQSDNKILVSGFFTTFNSLTAKFLVRLDSNGTTDSTFTTNMGSGFSNTVTKVKLQSDGKIICLGNFTNFNGFSSPFMVRLNTIGTRDTTLNLGTGFNSTTDDCAIQSDDKIIVVGNFTSYKNVSAPRIVRITSGGTTDTSFMSNVASGFNNRVNAVVIQPDGKIICGGEFTSYSGVTANRLIRLENDGTIDTAFLTNIGDAVKANNNLTCQQGNILSLTLQPDGKIIIGGYFSKFNNVGYGNILRLNSDGTVDTNFNTTQGFAQYSNINQTAVQLDNNIVVAGNFTSYDTYPNNLDDFGIQTYNIVNGLITGNPFFIYKNSGGVVTYSDPAYII